MNPINTLASIIDDPGRLSAPEKPVGLGRTGMLGYLFGTIGVFFFLRIFSAVPPGFFSFLSVLTFVLSLNFFMAGVIHLFMDLTGARGGAGRLFQAFGLTDYLLALLVPVAFLARAEHINAFLGYSFCVLGLIYARVRIVRRVYTVSTNKAALSVLLPYAWLGIVSFLASVYMLAWMIWLVI